MVMAGTTLDVEAIQEHLRVFVREREWEQFHDPKNLAMSLAIEAGELMEVFQWIPTGDSAAIMADPKKATAVREELADVMAYLLRLADVLSVDLHEAVWAKLSKNAANYPVHLSRGSSRKYNELKEDDMTRERYTEEDN